MCVWGGGVEYHVQQENVYVTVKAMHIVRLKLLIIFLSFYRNMSAIALRFFCGTKDNLRPEPERSSL